MTQYLLVRPHPSMRIIFVSPALRIPGLLQSPFLTRIGGPGHVRDGLSEAFESGESVTAKITWLPQGRGEDNDYSRPSSRGSDVGRTRYISCTPLLGSDDRVGVWMVVMVENEQVTGTLPSRTRARAEDRNGAEINGMGSEYEREDVVRPVTNPTSAAAQQRSDPRTPRTPNGRSSNTMSGNGNGYTYTAPSSGPGKLNGESGRLYADFLRSHEAQKDSNASSEQTPAPYGHRANEGLRREHYQRQQSSSGQIVGPGKVSTESESEETERNGLVDGLRSPRLRAIEGFDGVRDRE